MPGVKTNILLYSCLSNKFTAVSQIQCALLWNTNDVINLTAGMRPCTEIYYNVDFDYVIDNVLFH